MPKLKYVIPNENQAVILSPAGRIFPSRLIEKQGALPLSIKAACREGREQSAYFCNFPRTPLKNSGANKRKHQGLHKTGNFQRHNFIIEPMLCLFKVFHAFVNHNLKKPAL